MPVREILLLGDTRLYEPSEAVDPEEVSALLPVINDLEETMIDFQRRHGWGRAIAAPQIGVLKRIVCMHVDRPLVLLNPILDAHSSEKELFWEDCMSFPELLVCLENPVSCRLTYRDPEWREHRVHLSHDFAELLQHEVDHLDGVLSVQRARDSHSIALRRALPEKSTLLRGEFRPL